MDASRGQAVDRGGRNGEVGATMDPLDRIVGRAVIDPAFARLLLTSPAEALDPEPMPPGLKRALIALRARSIGEFARRALEAQAALRAAAEPRREPLRAGKVPRWIDLSPPPASAPARRLPPSHLRVAVRVPPARSDTVSVPFQLQQT
jgi:hypothetical protein